MFEEIQEKVDKTCEELRAEVLQLDRGLHGEELRAKIFELAGYQSRFSKLADKAALRYDIQKQVVDHAEDTAMQAVNSDPSLKGIAATLKEYYLGSYSIEIDGEQTTLGDQKIKLAFYKYASTRFSSLLELLKSTIMTAQVGLSYDKEEMKNIKYS